MSEHPVYFHVPCGNGHDTEKFGRIEEDSQLPWQTLNLNIENDKEFDTVEVAFLNDHCCR